MVFYFSATGNSKYVAKQISEKLGGDMVNISDAIKESKFEYRVKDKEQVFFIFPVYYYGLPSIVKDFLEKVSFIKGKPRLCAIMTCGSNAGGADRLFTKALGENSKYLKGIYTVKMVDNYILMMNVPLPEEQLMINRDADKTIDEIVKSIEFNYRVSYRSSFSAGIFSKISTKIYDKTRTTGKFWVKENCTGCELCKNICPIDVIQMDNGKPIWKKEQCIHCLACINRCPEEAIQYGKHTEKKGRYINQIMK